MIEYFLYLSPIFHHQNILLKTGDQELAKLRVRFLVGSPAFSLPMVYHASKMRWLRVPSTIPEFSVPNVLHLCVLLVLSLYK